MNRTSFGCRGSICTTGMLLPRERKFAEVYAATGHGSFAATQAGYPSPGPRATELVKRPIVQAAIRAEQERRLTDEALPLAVDWLVKCVSDETYKPADRNTAARIIIQNTISRADAGRDKAPEDMTPDELAARITILRARQAQLADGAKVIDGDAHDLDQDPPESDVFG